MVSGFRMVSGKKGFFDGQPEAFSVEESEQPYNQASIEMILERNTGNF